MKWISMLAAVTVALFTPVAVLAHDTPGLEHTHAFQKTAYGTYRQGHSVNSPLGDITIWSPRPYTGYQNGPAVNFARPEPITKAPVNPSVGSRGGQNPAPEYAQRKANPRRN